MLFVMGKVKSQLFFIMYGFGIHSTQKRYTATNFTVYSKKVLLWTMDYFVASSKTNVYNFKERKQKISNIFFFLSKCSMVEVVNTFIIIIIIMSCRRHGYPWPSLATSPYRSSLLAGLQDYIPYPHRAAVCMIELVVLLLLGHMWGSIGVNQLWARPCFSSSILHVWFV